MEHFKAELFMSFLTCFSTFLTAGHPIKESHQDSGKIIFSAAFYDDENLLEKEDIKIENSQDFVREHLRQFVDNNYYDYGGLVDDNQPKKREMSYTTIKPQSYDELKEEFQSYLKGNKTFHNIVEEEEGNSDANLEKAWNNLMRGNCSEEIPLDFGFRAYGCLSSNTTLNKDAVKIVLNAIWTWLLICLTITTILWCDKGWCSCCCPCRFCKISERIETIKVFLNNNPPGQWQDDDGIYNYIPSKKELELHDKMLEAILTL